MPLLHAIFSRSSRYTPGPMPSYAATGSGLVPPSVWLEEAKRDSMMMVPGFEIMAVHGGGSDGRREEWADP